MLDTNVILHDSSCIYNFQEHDIAIPITVLEELDQFKKGGSSLSYHAREFLRSLDSLSGDSLFSGGIRIRDGLGKIRVYMEQEFHPDLIKNFPANKTDHHILNIAYQIAKSYPAKQVILVSKDVNMRMKAKSLGMTAQNYTTDQVRDITTLYKGRRNLENLSDEIIERLYEAPYEVPVQQLPLQSPLIPNEYLIMRNGKKSALGAFETMKDVIRRVEKRNIFGIMPRNAEQIFALDALTNPRIPLVSLSGKAGTGKTLLAVCAALETRRNYRQIYIARPVVPLSNKDIGYLPGDIKSKLDPYMQPLYDNLAVISNHLQNSDTENNKIQDLLDSEKLVVSPLAYIRGRSLVKIYFIVDEAQNLTPHEIKTIITRAGEGTKIVFTGDIFQIDHPYLDSRSNGLSYLIEKMQGQPLYAHINLEKTERSELADLAAGLLN